MKIFYSRISSLDQNAERQLISTDGFDFVLTDKCSGLIPLWDRPRGKEIKKLIDAQRVSLLEVHSIDRLGRSTIDVLGVWKELTEKGITVVCRNPALRNFNERGEADIFSELMISILSTMSAFEKSLIRERQLEGIRIRKAKRLYAGRQISTKDSPEKFLAKARTQKIVRLLRDNYKYRDIALICKCSSATITKVKRATESNLLNIK